MTRDIMVIYQVTPPSNKPYRLMETFYTSDGVRTRICDGTFKTLEEANTDRLRRLDERREHGQAAYERGVRDGLSREREDEFKRGDPGHPDNDMGM